MVKDSLALSHFSALFSASLRHPSASAVAVVFGVSVCVCFCLWLKVALLLSRCSCLLLLFFVLFVTAYCLVSALLILSHHFHLSKLIWNALLFLNNFFPPLCLFVFVSYIFCLSFHFILFDLIGVCVSVVVCFVCVRKEVKWVAASSSVKFSLFSICCSFHFSILSPAFGHCM